VDDQEANLELIECILASAGFDQYRHTTDSREVLALWSAFQPDLLLLDLFMPHNDGFAVMAQLAAELPGHEYLPILVLTGDVTSEVKERALSSGASDFLSKPFDTTEVILRIKNLLRTRYLHTELRRYNETLEAKVRERTRQLAEAQLEIFDRLAIAAEYRDDDTGQHTKRVGNLAAMIARALGQSDDQIEILRLAATLHDVGKIGVPDRVLLKPGKLSPEEFEIIKSHTTIGTEILGRSKFSILKMSGEIAASHHERWDGSGYPQGLKGEQIPLCGRIVAIADVFDALTHDRPYKQAWSLEAAVTEMKRLSGIQFDPNLITVFLSIVETNGIRNLAENIESIGQDQYTALPLLQE